jgi:hypothetical protein
VVLHELSLAVVFERSFIQQKYHATPLISADFIFNFYYCKEGKNIAIRLHKVGCNLGNKVTGVSCNKKEYKILGD